MSKFSRLPQAVIDRAISLQTPALLYDVSAIALRAEAVQKAFCQMPTVTIAFSVKANRNKEVLALISSLGFAASVSSIPELDYAKAAGFKQIFATSPAFSVKELGAFLIDHNIFPELNSLSQVKLCGRHFPSHSIGIRLRLKTPRHLQTPRFHGVESRFGIDANDPELIAIIEKYGMTLMGLHIHLGDLQRPQQTLWSLQTILDIAERFQDVKRINCGGGWYPLYCDHAVLADTANQIASLVKAWERRTGRSLHMVFEPGAFLLLDNAYLLVSVLAVDAYAQGLTTCITVDASAWNYLPWTKPKVIATFPQRDTIRACRIAGNTCYENDILVEEQVMKVPEIGDRFLLDAVGAYVNSNARSIHGHPLPREYLVSHRT